MSNLSEAPLDMNAQMRLNMVNSQVRPNQVNDRRVIGAMRDLPREDFVPAGRLAYTDADIPLDGGRFMPAPMLMARLAQLVLVNNPQNVLIVGAGTGYGAALLAHAGAKVVALDDTPGLISPALADSAPDVTVVTGDLKTGWPALGPYDAILFEGAVMAIPDEFKKQLAPGGRIVTILADGPEAGGIGRAVVAEPGAGGFAVARMFDCTARILPAFFSAPVFVF